MPWTDEAMNIAPSLAELRKDHVVSEPECFRVAGICDEPLSQAHCFELGHVLLLGDAVNRFGPLAVNRVATPIRQERLAILASFQNRERCLCGTTLHSARAWDSPRSNGRGKAHF